MSVFEDFQEVTPLRCCQDGEAPIVDYQHLHAGDGFEDAFVTAAIAGQSKASNMRGTLIQDGPPLTARLVAEGAGQLGEGFLEGAEAGWEDRCAAMDAARAARKAANAAKVAALLATMEAERSAPVATVAA